MKDSLIIGILLGLIAPVAGMMVYYSLFLSHRKMATVMERVIADGSITSLVSLGCIANLALFYAFYHFKWDRSARGVIMATFVYVGYVLFVKFA